MHKSRFVLNRLGTALRKFQAQVVTEKQQIKSGTGRMSEQEGKGMLTDQVVHKLTKYYGIAVRRYINDIMLRIQQCNTILPITYLCMSCHPFRAPY